MNLHDFFNEGREIKEGVMKDIHIELSDIVANEDFDALYKLFSADTPAGRFVQDMYDDIVIDTGLHPDDDFERIEQIVFDRLADEFGEEGMSENSLNEFAADDGNDGGEDDALRNYARMWWGGDEATQMQIERALARMGWEIGEDEGGYDNGGVFVVRAGDVNGNSYQSWAAEDLTEGLTEIDRRGFLKGMGAAAVAGTAGGANAFDFGKKNNEKKFEDFITEPADKEKYLGLHKKAKQLYTAMVINPSLRAAAYVEIAAFKKFKKQMAEKYKISDNLDEQGVVEGRLTNFDNLSDAELIRLAHRGYISGNLEYNHDGHLVNRDEIIRLLKATDDSAEENDDDFMEQGVAEATGDEKFDTMMGQIQREPKYPDSQMPPTDVKDLYQWAVKNNKPYHKIFAEWANREGYKSVAPALQRAGDLDTEALDYWTPRVWKIYWGEVRGIDSEMPPEWSKKRVPDELRDYLETVFDAYDRIVFDWPTEYRQIGGQDNYAEGASIVSRKSLETYIRKGECPGCGGTMVAEGQLNEKQDACYHKVKSRYKVWPSAYASGALVQCRKKGAANWGDSNESITQEEYDQLDENLKKWFSDKWVRFGPDGKIRGDCARGDDSEGKPKCLPQSKAHSLGKKGRASAASRKRREDPDPERSGKAINVSTDKKSNEGMAEARKKKKSSRSLGRYFFPGYGYYGSGESGEGGGDGGGESKNRGMAEETVAYTDPKAAGAPTKADWAKARTDFDTKYPTQQAYNQRQVELWGQKNPGIPAPTDLTGDTEANRQSQLQTLQQQRLQQVKECAMTEEGAMCPVHGLNECGNAMVYEAVGGIELAEILLKGFDEKYPDLSKQIDRKDLENTVMDAVELAGDIDTMSDVDMMIDDIALEFEFEQEPELASEPMQEPIKENKLYYNVIGTPANQLRSNFGLRKDANGWYLNEDVSIKRLMTAFRAFGEPTRL